MTIRSLLARMRSRNQQPSYYLLDYSGWYLDYKLLEYTIGKTIRTILVPSGGMKVTTQRLPLGAEERQRKVGSPMDTWLLYNMMKEMKDSYYESEK